MIKVLTLLAFFIPTLAFSQSLEGVWITNQGSGETHHIERITFTPTRDGCYMGNVVLLKKNDSGLLDTDLLQNFAVHCVDDHTFRLIMLDGNGEERTLVLVKENGFPYLRIPVEQGFQKNEHGHFIEYVPAQ
jgi:hypothetical protein